MAIFTQQVGHWRRQAEEYRTLADTAEGKSAREAYRSLAADCERLAERFDETIDAAKRDGTPTP